MGWSCALVSSWSMHAYVQCCCSGNNQNVLMGYTSTAASCLSGMVSALLESRAVGPQPLPPTLSCTNLVVCCLVTHLIAGLEAGADALGRTIQQGAKARFGAGARQLQVRPKPPHGEGCWGHTAVGREHRQLDIPSGGNSGCSSIPVCMMVLQMLHAAPYPG